MREPTRPSSDTGPSSPGANGAASGLLRALEAATRERPTERKRLVGPDINYGREYLAALARATGGWIGWEATTLRVIAEDLAFVPLSERGVRPGSDIEIGALINGAIDRVVQTRQVSGRFAALESSQGFRQSVRDSLLELRTGGVSPGTLRAAATPAAPAHDLTIVQEEFEHLLAQSGLSDPAGVFHAALDAFDREAPYVLDGAILLAPTLIVRGLAGRLAERLLAHGARMLASDPVIGVEPPAGIIGRRSLERGLTPAGEREVRDAGCSALAWIAAAELPPAEPRAKHGWVRADFFAAATPSEELREVCRRIVGEGWRWDDVEIVATDTDTYGIAMDALCQHLGVGATMLRGVPLARTRIGRALDRWLAWLEHGLPADVLRQALEAGEVEAPESDVAPPALARELRPLRIGWGRARYEAALASLESGRRLAELKPREDESEAEFVERREVRRRLGAALASLLRALLGATPEVPERGSDRPVRSSCAALARATLRWLELAPLHGMTEEQTAVRLRTRLEQLADVEDGETAFSSAMAALRDALADVRAWPSMARERRPWSAAGGMLHLTDVLHAGSTARPRIFVVGLDADRAQGGGRQDPLLPDPIRRAVAPDALASASDRRDEAAFLLASAFASLRGRVTLSYALSGSLDGREAGPAAVLLQAWRIERRDRTLSYEALRDALRPPASAVPTRDSGGELGEAACLDARDVWLDAIADGALLLDGASVVRAAFPMLDSGLRTAELAAGPVLTAAHGLVPAAAVLDPTAREGLEISPSALEKLASCPLAWFYRYGLSLYPPDDPEYDPDRWLDALQRGSLLHEIYESFTRTFQGRQDGIHEERAAASMRTLTDDAIARWRAAVPPPGEAVFAQEAAELHRAAMAFLQMERELAARGDAGRWLELELGFGSGEPAGVYRLNDGTILAIKGRADRVDELPDATLRVVDYKTGRAAKFSKKPKAGPFNGGRQLQPALYAGVLEALLGREVTRFEYRFPTERGGNEIVGYATHELAAARDIVASLLDHVRAGTFVPTTDTTDCSYCDHQAVCRASRGDHGTTSPRAAWAQAHAPMLDTYRAMRLRRGEGGLE